MTSPIDEKPLFEPYSVRERVDLPALYSLDPIPAQFRAHLVHILIRLIGSRVIDGMRTYSKNERRSADIWSELATDVAESLAVTSLSKGSLGGSPTPAYSITSFIENTSTSTLDILDVIETLLHKCRSWQDSGNQTEREVSLRVDRACAEINQRFRQHYLAYRVQNDLIVRVDCQYMFQEATSPAFELLNESGFEGALDEFIKAHHHYLNDEPRSAIASAHSAFESTLKTICDRKQWSYNKDRDGAKRLIDIVVRERGLLPDLLLPTFKHFLLALEQGLPRLGNQKGRHGQGSVPEVPPEHLVAYALHLSAANIVLLMEAFTSGN